jgi:hypothetical protein
VEGPARSSFPAHPFPLQWADGEPMDETGLTINDQDYFEMPGLNVLVYHNTF